VYTRCRDVGVVARMFPDVRFLIYHAGYEHAVEEGPYDAARAQGIDGLIKSLEDNKLPPNGNVVAELGSTWHALMKKPTEAAHALGKLLKYVGEDNVVWGTDAIWYGSPQEQIVAFRAFEIAEELQEKHGYPALTAERKAKIFGLNAARIYGVDPKAAKAKNRDDPVGRAKEVYLQSPSPSFRSYGPRTRREVLALRARSGGLP
jgi:predicted TIM-barrel fold metal-dependent hydrolase